MIAVDTNILIYAHRQDAPLHHEAATKLRALAEGRAPWGLPWPCVHEFLAIATHPRIWDPPTPRDKARAQVAAWLSSPSVVLLGETADHFEVLAELAGRGQVRGAMIHDARVAAICLCHGVAELWTTDRDFSRFPTLPARNPLIGR